MSAGLRNCHKSGSFVTALVLLVGLGWRSMASAATAPPISVTSQDCPSLDRTELGRLLAIEVSREVVANVESTAVALRVEVVCKDDGFKVVVKSVDGRTLANRLFSLGGNDRKVWLRFVVLAAAELVEMSLRDLTVREPAPARTETIEKAPTQSLPSATPQRPMLTQLWSVGLLGRVLPERDGLSWGLNLALQQPLHQRMGLHIDLQTEYAHRDVELGSVRTTSVSTACLATLSSDSQRRLAVVAGLGMRAGFSHSAGSPHDDALATGNAFTAPWFGPAGRAALHTRVSASVRLGVAVELGYNAVSTRGTVARDTDVGERGPWLGIMLIGAWQR